ncbi:hypothetical protein ACFYTC_22080 [Actinomadura nitritigenes]|uniref:hypothetical protein n=1 Tax=Actinomadura nitritigenes TaxID=134602 RepID=UPI0036D0D58C
MKNVADTVPSGTDEHDPSSSACERADGATPVVVARPNDPTRLFSWDVRSDGGGLGGVTDDEGLAIRHVREAVDRADGDAHGLVRRVGLSQVGGPAYVEFGVVGEAWRDEETGAVVWREA